MVMSKNYIRRIILMIFASVAAVATASAQKGVDWNDLLTVVDENHRTVYYDRQTNNPLKGDFRIKRGLDVEVVKLKNGVIDGEYHRYRNGELREAGHYDKGLRNGVFTEYYSDGKSVKRTAPMNNGKIDGIVKTFYNDGSLESEKEYSMSVENGIERKFAKSTGEQTFEAHYVDGKKEGEEWEKGDNGNGTYSHIFRNYSGGKLDGKFRTELIRDGEVIYLIEGEYSQGEKTGQWKETNFETY